MEFIRHRYTFNIGGADLPRIFPASRTHRTEAGKSMTVYDVEVEFEARISNGVTLWTFSHVIISGTRETFLGRTKEMYDYQGDAHRLPLVLHKIVLEVSQQLTGGIVSPWKGLNH